MPILRVYLDNCCYNRPYDDQTQQRIWDEAQAKILIQSKIKNNELELVSSFVLEYECSRSRYDVQRNYIQSFLEDNTSIYIDSSYDSKVKKIAEEIMKTGVKRLDAYHTACAIIADCDYFVTTDDRLLKYIDERISIVTPDEFVRIEGGAKNA